VAKAWLVGLVAALVLLVGESPAQALARQDVVISMDDGVPIAATLHLPDGAPPAGGWPGIVLLHGLPGNRSQMNDLVAVTGLSAQGYAVLTYDARGVGGSGGLVSAAGPRDVADVRALHAWLGARADVDAGRIAALGISYGGGIALNSLVAGVPWRAVFAAQTWTDLASALAPQGLVKTGALGSYLAAIPPERRDPSLAAAAAAALAGNTVAVRQWASERSSLQGLASVQTPVFLAQGRRDFLFDLEQGALAFSRLQGAKVLYLGLHGHAPSTFPAADTGTLLQLGTAWLACHLRGGPCDPTPASVYLAPESFAGQVVRRGTLPPTSPRTFALAGVSTFAQRGRSVRRTSPLRSALEVFGTPTVTTTVAASGGWSRLVAVLTARTPQGREIVVGTGGVPTRPGARTVTIRLSSQATFLPQGSRLTLTLASSSTAQMGSSPLYLDLPMPPTARARVGNAVLRLPTLRTPVTR
jgi:predicted acyl esterase